MTSLNNNTPIAIPVIGARFNDLAELRKAIDDWILAEGLSYSVRRVEQRCLILYCRKPDICTFKLTTHPRAEFWQITAYTPHTCPSITHNGWRIAASAKRLASHHNGLVAALPSTQPNALVIEERLQFRNQVSYMQGFRVKQAITREVLGKETQWPYMLSKRGWYEYRPCR